MRTRLLLAFFAIAAFAVLAAGVGIYAFREVGGRLNVVDTRIPPTLSALELSRSAERIIAAAPALLAASDRARRDEVKAELAAEIERLNRKLGELKIDPAQAQPLRTLEAVVSLLSASLGDLDRAVERRIATSERIATLRRRVFLTNEETQRLLAPWLEVVNGEIAALVEAPQTAESGDRPRIASLMALQRLMRTAEAQVSAVVDLLAEASTTDRAERLPILSFQLDLALRDLAAAAPGLDPRLRPMFLEQSTKLRAFTEGPNAIAEARRQEMLLVGEAKKRLFAAAGLSAQLTDAVDRLGSAAKQDIGEAIGDALSVQRLSARAMVAAAALSLLTSLLIVWLYVGGNIVRRLTALGDGMLAIASGSLRTPPAVDGNDEIAAMGRAVEVFRRNTLERDELLAEKAEAAERLEKEVQQRTAELAEKSRQLEISNRNKSHFLASASHDLRQPLHALNLFVGQVRANADPTERERLIGRIDAAVGSMNELFDALLDMSKLEAGVLVPEFTEFPIDRLLKRIETTFAEPARNEGLHLSIVGSGAWVRSDFVLLERILFNLVSNAVRYTARGGLVVGVRHRGAWLRIDVCDTGFGIPEEQQSNVFGEFYQLPSAGGHGGLGLGLSIVKRLGGLLDHHVELDSRPGRGSRFSVSVPLVAMPHRSEAASISPTIADPARGKLVIVIDDDALVLDGMHAILRGWGCDVITANSGEAALVQVAARARPPDVIISDYRLASGETGIKAIERLRDAAAAPIPAFLVSGDTAPERSREASEKGLHLLHKPVAPMRLRAMLTQALKTAPVGELAPPRDDSRASPRVQAERAGGDHRLGTV